MRGGSAAVVIQYKCTCFGMMAVTVDLQGLLNICTRVGFGRGGPL